VRDKSIYILRVQSLTGHFLFLELTTYKLSNLASIVFYFL